MELCIHNGETYVCLDRTGPLCKYPKIAEWMDEEVQITIIPILFQESITRLHSCWPAQVRRTFRTPMGYVVFTTLWLDVINLSNRLPFLWASRRNYPRGMLRDTREAFFFIYKIVYSVIDCNKIEYHSFPKFMICTRSLELFIPLVLLNTKLHKHTTTHCRPEWRIHCNRPMICLV